MKIKPKWIKVLQVIESVFSVLLVGFLTLQVITYQSPRMWTYPIAQTEEVSLSTVLKKDSFSEEDYLFLEEQTGVTKEGVDRLQKYNNLNLLPKIQKEYHTEYEIYTEYDYPLMSRENLRERLTFIDLEAGDILLALGSHCVTFDVGHAALVTDPAAFQTFEISGYGDTSGFGTTRYFQKRPAFAILSVNCPGEMKKKVVDNAINNLQGIPYSLFDGLLYPKDKQIRKQCASLIDYAYRSMGVTLVDDPGWFVSPHDLLNGEHVTVLQYRGI